ncbi:UPF0462 protein C4orf33 homolog isoform X2 [Ascaphus truei]|uniref:UPF0462 protein C4orf33 homolog isoform X2 n=1 Tax=Ascaphus truei TaxID=8439 RepID=UPI003F5A0591
MEFRIEHQWNSAPVAHEPVTIWLKSVDGGLRMDVSAPFFNDPPAPPGAAGQPLSGLWDYEVVEAFFLNSNTEQYLEVEVCPHGQHLVLLLSQRRNIWKESLPLSLQVSRTDTTWNGCALLPWDYFPPSVDKFNAYAIHGSELERTYEALYPVPQHAVQEGHQPDLSQVSSVISEKEVEKHPATQLVYKITTTWDSKPVLHEPVTITFKSHEEGLLMEVHALFFDDPPKPPGEPGEPFDGLWDFEVVESFFLNSRTTQYLEVELCPHGQHLVLLLSGVGNAFKKELELKFEADTTLNWGKWHGTALIPWHYFPPDVDMMNSYAIHGSGIGRVYEALYPIPQEDISEGQSANFHRLEYFKAFNLKSIMGEDWEKPSSNLWESAP